MEDGFYDGSSRSPRVLEMSSSNQWRFLWRAAGKQEGVNHPSLVTMCIIIIVNYRH